MKVHIRWMIRKDMPEVLQIEKDCFPHPWSEEDFIRCMRQRNCIGMVAEHEEKVVGYMIYELHRTRLHVLNMAVASNHQRKGVGAAMVEKLFSKLSNQRRDRLMLEVCDTNLNAHLFFSKMGFEAVSVLRNFYEHIAADAYLFQYRLRDSNEQIQIHSSRISKLFADDGDIARRDSV